MTSFNLGKSSDILRSEKVYGMKISQSIFHAKEYSDTFFSTLKDIIEAQSKTNH